jgi:hypothetical protein
MYYEKYLTSFKLGVDKSAFVSTVLEGHTVSLDN